MTDDELTAWLRQEEVPMWAGQLAADRIEELVAELDLMKTAGIIEIASRNNRVTEYMFYWEGRALDAEAKLAKAMAALRFVKPLLGNSFVEKRALAMLAELEGK